MLLFNCGQHVAQLRLIREFAGADHLRRAFHVNLPRAVIAEDDGIAQRQRALHDAFIPFALGRQFLQKIAANRLQRPPGIVAIQEVRRRIQFDLRERSRRPQDFVARIAARRNQHDDHAPVGQQPHARMLDHRLAHRRRHDDAEPIRHFRQHVTGALGHFRCVGRHPDFALNPFLIHNAQLRLRRDFLRKKTIGSGRRHTPRRSVRLIQKAAVLKLAHHVANRRGADGFLEARRDSARRHGFACLDIRPHNIGQESDDYDALGERESS